MIESRWRGGEIFRTRPDRPWGPPSHLCNGYRVFLPGVKRPGRGVDHPPPSSVDVEGRIELYLYLPLGLRGLLWGEISSSNGLVTGLLPRWVGFDARSLHIACRICGGQSGIRARFYLALELYPATVIPARLHTHFIYHRYYIMLATIRVFKPYG